ncbi:FIST C-terminal domain-containing protein [candidate division KSB1 bacterium]|nr:FIST C-terminal domain-containing protein [candidate division KSB1 bacterium]
MATKAGVGFSENPKSFDAGVEAAKTAMAEAGVSKCDLAMMYSTSKHDPAGLRDGVRSVIGAKTRLVGGYSNGIITRDRLGYDGYQMGVAVLASDTIDIDMFMGKGLANNEFNVGISLGNQIKSKTYNGTPNILLMYDFVKEKPLEGMSWNINWATPLLEGMEQSLGTWPPVAGVAMMGDWQCNPTYQWFDDQIERHTAIALVLSGGVRMDTLIMHGCKPLSDYHTITKADQNVVLEIDGKQAMDVIAELLGPERFKEWLDYPFFVILGVNRGEKYGEFGEENYANRLIAGVDKERGGLIMFEPDLKVGTEVQLMRRSFSDFEYVRKYSKEMLKRTQDRNPFFCFYIDCAGRASAYSGTEGEEAEEVQKVIGSQMPLLGLYSGTEICKVGSVVQPCVFTGILCVFSD